MNTTEMAVGMMAVGIPEYRPPRDMLAHEIDGIRRRGVEIMTSSSQHQGATAGSDVGLCEPARI